ncbi:unnamed protein product [Caenorhabditis nigoni]|uniref:Uncharacterized protein n=1 Tax=Caenorhabditis nigoni TaxID=1611254 RepID=A0A2G5UMF5_9PELO|nr:hypothetical protein B9Z55_008399 [Caenorhabditis nigoni]
MNNLVDYGADSDEESPRRRSSEGHSSMTQKFLEHNQRMEKEAAEKRKRRSSDVYGENSDRSDDDEPTPQEFSEPPPPKRVDYHSPTPALRTPQFGMPHTSSQASLVSYSADGDEEDDDSAEYIPQKVVEMAEPAPPARKSRNNEEEDDEEQKLIDMAIREGNEAIMRMNQNEVSPGDTPGHDSVVDSPFNEIENLERTPRQAAPEGSPNADDEIRIPPPPNVEVNPGLVALFENAFRQKARGADLNQQIQGNPKYNNPMIYTTFIETFNIDEKGTNFPKNIFDPHVFPENCYYDAIGEEQRKMTEPAQKKK